MRPCRIFLTIDGVTMTTRQAAEMYGLTQRCIQMRLKRGYSHEDAVRPAARPFELVDGERRLERLRVAKKRLRGPERAAASEDEREARAMMRFGRKDAEIAEWFGWSVDRVAALRTQEIAR